MCLWFFLFVLSRSFLVLHLEELDFVVLGEEVFKGKETPVDL